MRETAAYSGRLLTSSTHTISLPQVDALSVVVLVLDADEASLLLLLLNKEAASVLKGVELLKLAVAAEEPMSGEAAEEELVEGGEPLEPPGCASTCTAGEIKKQRAHSTITTSRAALAQCLHMATDRDSGGRKRGRREDNKHTVS